ncbi:MAG TPA: hypothetical protein VFM14_08030 [Gemmatimonadales bacterium]|nr:hypothetical protein [Gemmatimonadales bacterium]
MDLLVALLWLGVGYGVADALLLSIVPVLCLYGTRGAESRRGIGPRLR